MYLGEMFGTGIEGEGEGEKGEGEGKKEKESLYPALGPRRGEAMKWIVWANMNMAVAAARFAGLLEGTGNPGAVEAGSVDAKPAGADADAPKKQEADKSRDLADLQGYLQILNDGLSGRAYLLGEGYSLADTHVWALVRWVGMLGVGLEEYENVAGWMERVGGREVLKGVE